MGLSDHFYSHMDPVWSLLIVGTGFVPWVELPIQMRLLDFHEWCRVTRHPRVFRRLTGCQRIPGGVETHIMDSSIINSQESFPTAQFWTHQLLHPSKFGVI